MKILIKGTAGFIGYHLVKRLLNQKKNTIIGLDNINSYYDVTLKEDRLKECGISKTEKENEFKWNTEYKSKKYKNYSFYRINLQDKEPLFNVIEKYKPEFICHLAAQAGVRYSLSHPEAYIETNIYGFLNILEACKTYHCKHLIYASSSSVYGLNKKIPLSVSDNVDHPISLYAASKKSNELMAHVYSHLYNIPTTGLRFFTVYGPWGRPDMALFKFVKSIYEDKPIDVYNNGNMKRDFTYIDDIVTGIEKIIQFIPAFTSNYNFEYPDPATSSAPYRVYNIGNGSPVNLMDFVKTIEKIVGKEAKKNFIGM